MTQKIFTPEFYRELFNYFVDYMNENGWYNDQIDDVVNNKFIAMDCDKVGGVYVTCEVEFDFERNYSSPYDNPYKEYVDIVVTEVYDIKDVHVYENSNKDSKEIFGFDKEAFFEANKNV